jgi:hypothetical protein
MKEEYEEEKRRAEQQELLRLEEVERKEEQVPLNVDAAPLDHDVDSLLAGGDETSTGADGNGAGDVEREEKTGQETHEPSSHEHASQYCASGRGRQGQSKSNAMACGANGRLEHQPGGRG